MKFCDTMPMLIMKDEPSNQVTLFKLNESVPSAIAYSILVDRTFHVTAFRGTCQIKVKDLIPTFSHVLSKYSPLNLAKCSPSYGLHDFKGGYRP